MAPAHLTTTWDVRVAAGPSPATVRVKNLQTTVQGPQDAWGRPNRPQPLTVSAAVSLAQPFGSSSSADALAPDTVHYGLLSKAILATLARTDSGDGVTSSAPSSLARVLDNIWDGLSGSSLYDDDSVAAVPSTPGGEPRSASSFLDLRAVRHLSITMCLPKATLLGAGVSLTTSAVFSYADGVQSNKDERRLPVASLRAARLRLHDLRVPTLIGVNDNERKAKQVVVANLTVERFDVPEDGFCALETVVVETMSNSSYETLEALGADIARRVARHLVSHQTSADELGWQIDVRLEKPIAVVLADAACVEVSAHSRDLLV